MKQIILGTAGHIDHGKTSLIKALTGTETDRLKEEKLRGITIELGFASMDLPSGQHLGIVDVPGHEKFVKNMVAGASGIDIVSMVIAADEGVMPQTKEHMEICTLLGIKHGLVILTKVDMVDEEWLELVMEDVREYMEGTFLDGVPILPVSSLTGDGIPELIGALDKLSAEIPDRPPTSIFRLPVDRVFSMKGFGTVITGTLASGNLAVGDNIMIYPSRITSKVRGIQVHSSSVETAGAGMRTAINFQGLDKTAVNRGDVVSTPEILKPSYMIDGSFTFLASNKKPLRDRTRIRFHTGTSEIIGYLVPLEKEEIAPGETAVVQLRLDTAVSCVKDDHFVIRSYSPVRTIGGGQVLNPIPQKHKRFRPEIIEGLKSLLGGEPSDVISFHASQSSYNGVSFSDLKIMTNLGDKQLNNALQLLLSKKTVIQIDKENRIYIHKDVFDKLMKESVANLGAYHKANPLKAGMPKEELKSKFPAALGQRFFNLLLTQMVKDNSVVQEEDMIRLSGHAVALQIDQKEVREKLLATYGGAGLTPPYFKALCETLEYDFKSARTVLDHLVEEGVITKVKEDLYFAADTVESLKKQLVDFLLEHGEITTPQFKDMTQATRKYVIPLIEYFDSRNVTIRVGDTRHLRNKDK